MKNNNNNLIYFVVGEPSGDLHASNLIKQINIITNNSKVFRGVGGPLMEKEGLVSVEDFRRLSVMGFVEVLKNLPFFLKLKKTIINDIDKQKPSSIILVDYPGFNLKIAKVVKERFGIPVFYYISPQLWAWKARRVQIIKKYVDHLIAIFPFEVEWYKKRGVDVHFFGHPLVDIYKQKNIKKNILSKNSIGIFPGSREQEVNRHVPILKKVIQSLRLQNPKFRFVLGLANGVSENIIYNLGLNDRDCVIKNNSLMAFEVSDVAIVASGTATLECALAKTPCVVIYKTSFLSWFFASRFIKINFISIINILANKMIVAELLQKNCNVRLVCQSINQVLISDNKQYEESLDGVLSSLGCGDSYFKTATYIVGSLSC